VVIYTVELDVLLICRQSPPGFWQSVTGSLEHGENPQEAAQRELFEETGICRGVVNHRIQRVFPIKPAWQKRYAPGVSENLEHEFGVQLAERCGVTLDPDEHSDYQWLPIIDAIAKVSSRSNRSALQSILRAEG
jgi:dATP pyrophosphohydrolase